MKTITITLTDAEAILLDNQAKQNAMMGMAGMQSPSFEAEIASYKTQRLVQARELAKRKVTEPMTDEQLANAITEVK
jgi:hypothetical protein